MLTVVTYESTKDTSLLTGVVLVVLNDNKYVVDNCGLFIVIDLENTSPIELVINRLYIPEHKFVNIGELVYVTPLSIEYENGGLSKLELNIMLPSHKQVG
jgi:hypothetical protein